MVRIALYQPEIPQNTGTLLRLGSCLGVGVDIIEPCGFAFSDRKLKRAGMDYLSSADYVRYSSWHHFLESKSEGRLVLLTPDALIPYTDFQFEEKDTLLLGRESSGVDKEVEERVESMVKIPMVPERRSINVALATGMVLGETLRQTRQFPGG